MAIDSAEKRRAAAGVPFLGYGVTPTSGKDAEWRSQVGWSWSGFLVEAVPFTITATLTPMLAITGALVPQLGITGTLEPKLGITATLEPGG